MSVVAIAQTHATVAKDMPIRTVQSRRRVELSAAQWAPAGVVVLALAIVVVSGAGAASAGSASSAVFGALATVALSVLYGWVLLVAVGAVRRRHLKAALFGLIVVEAAGSLLFPTPPARYWWLGLTHAVAVGALVAFPGLPGLVGAALAVTFPAAVFLAMGLGPDFWATAPVQAAWRTVTVYVLIWLVNALGLLATSREQLLEQSIAAERARLDRRLADTVGAALQDLTVIGTDILDAPPARDATAQLATIVDRARAAMAEARLLVRSLPVGTVAEELEAAQALLQAAGIRSFTVVHGLAVSAPATELRPVLQSCLQDLLAQRRPPASCLLTVQVTPAGGVQVWIDDDSARREASR